MDVAGVESMTAERDKGTHTRRERDVPRDVPIGCFCEGKQLQQIL